MCLNTFSLLHVMENEQNFGGKFSNLSSINGQNGINNVKKNDLRTLKENIRTGACQSCGICGKSGSHMTGIVLIMGFSLFNFNYSQIGSGPVLEVSAIPSRSVIGAEQALRILSI